jgi:hypothetical protein
VAPTLWGPLELVSITGHATPFLPEDGSRASFRNVDFKDKHWTMDKILKQDFFEMHHTIVRTLQNRFMDVCLLCLYFELSYVGRGLCDGLLGRPEESYHASNYTGLRRFCGNDNNR